VSDSPRAGIDRLREVSQIWSTFDADQAAAWADYAATITHHNPLNGQAYTPIGYNIFTALASKFRQISPTLPIPLTPPATPFISGYVQVSATVVAGKIRFTASSWNVSGQTTELLLQKLVNVRRRPGDAYKSYGFHVFSAGSPNADVSVLAGVYAVAIRIVEATTGRQTPWQRVGILVVV
jgi:hypothetical protein